MKNRAWISRIVMFCTLFMAITAHSEDEDWWKTARITRMKDTGISGLRIKPRAEVQFISNNKDKSYQIFIQLQGLFQRPQWSLLSLKGALVDSTADNRRFSYKVQLKSEVTSVRFKAVGPRGDVEYVTYFVKFPGYRKYSAWMRNRVSEIPHMTASLGPTYIMYKELDVPDYSAIVMTAKASLNLKIASNKMDAAVSAYFTAMTLSSNLPGVSVRFLGVNGRIGYATGLLKKPWTMSLLGGLYYLTMMVNPQVMGFKNLIGPQFYPIVQKELPNDRLAFVYLKFAPIVSLSMSLKNREMAIGGGYVWNLKKDQHPLSVNVDYASSQLTISSVKLSTTSISASFGYGLF